LLARRPSTGKDRDGWFYMDESDQAYKRFFRLMGVLWNTAIAESAAKGSAAPVLTVPVSRQWNQRKIRKQILFIYNMAPDCTIGI